MPLKEQTNKENHMENFIVKGHNGLELFCTKYANVKNPKAVILIIHGMMEHSGRYVNFAKMLESNGFLVVTSDNRGHGKTMKSKEFFGHGEGDIYGETIKDQMQIIKYIQENFPSLPIYLFGHSYGSMLSQKLLQIAPVDKIVLCGTNYGNNISYVAGKCLAKVFKVFGKDKAPGKLFERMSLDSWGKPFEKGNWLTRDEAIFDAYKADPFCNGSFPNSFYRSLFSNMTKVNKGIKDIEKHKKILLIVGDKDPVSSGGKLVKKLHKQYLKHGVDAKLIVYDGARHELINELNKETVYKDVLEFYNN